MNINCFDLEVIMRGKCKNINWITYQDTSRQWLMQLVN